MSAIFYACSSDDPQAPKSDDDDDNSEIIDQTIIERAHEQLDYVADLTSTYSDDADKLIENIRLQDFISSVSVDETTVKAITKDGFTIEIDLVPTPCEPAETESDNNKQEQLVTTILSHFDLDSESDDAETVIIDGDDEDNLNSTSRAGSTPPLKYMTNRSILVFSPDETFRKYDWDRVINAVKMAKSSVGAFTINRHAIKSYKPEYFKQFSNFGIVVVGCHGTPEGKLLFPFDGMTEVLKNRYTSMAQDAEQTGVSFAVKKVLNKDGREVGVRKGVFLGEEFFNKYMGDLSRTIVWTAKCYSGRTLAQFRESCVVKKKAVEYYGATAPCTGKEVFDIFDVWFAGVSHGMDLWNAFMEAPEASKVSKILNSGGRYEWNTNSKAKYPKPQATGVKNQTSRSGDSAEPVTVGVRFRYAVDENGKPVDNTSAGVELTNLEDNSITLIPMTAENSKLSNSHPVNETFVISDYDMTLTGLNDKGNYRYRTYMKNGEEMVFSAESFDFTAQNSTIFEIYTKADFIKFLNGQYPWGENVDPDIADHDIVLKNDISVEYTEFAKTKPRLSTFNNIFDGQDHSIRILMSEQPDFSLNGDPHLFYINQGTIKNLTIEFNCSLPASTITGILCQTNTGEIINCNFNFDIENSIGEPHNDSMICQSNHGVISDCSIECISNGTAIQSLMTFDNYGTIKNIAVSLDLKNTLFQGLLYINKGTIDNITFNGDFNMRPTKFNYSYLLCYTNENNVCNCTNNATITPDAVPENNEQLTPLDIFVRMNSKTDGMQPVIENCINNANITGDGIALIGSNWENCIIKNCHNYGNFRSLRSPIAGWYLGAICHSNSGSITGCSNSGDVSASVDDFMRQSGYAGICGRNDGGVISDCINSGNITNDSTGGASGICWISYNGALISDCLNNGMITGTTNTAGICGMNYNIVQNCTNRGNIVQYYKEMEDGKFSQIMVPYESGTESGIKRNCKELGRIIANDKVTIY